MVSNKWLDNRIRVHDLSTLSNSRKIVGPVLNIIITHKESHIWFLQYHKYKKESSTYPCQTESLALISPSRDFHPVQGIARVESGQAHPKRAGRDVRSGYCNVNVHPSESRSPWMWRSLLLLEWVCWRVLRNGSFLQWPPQCRGDALYVRMRAGRLHPQRHLFHYELSPARAGTWPSAVDPTYRQQEEVISKCVSSTYILGSWICTYIYTYKRKEGLGFQQLRSYRDVIETRNREEIHFSLRIVCRGLSVAEGLDSPPQRPEANLLFLGSSYIHTYIHVYIYKNQLQLFEQHGHHHQWSQC